MAGCNPDSGQFGYDGAVEQPTEKFPAKFFRREDESSDPEFYVVPRLVVHIDDGAVAAVSAYLGSVLPADGAVLDLMSAWRSHLPESYVPGEMVGLGMNEVELRENPQLDERIVHDLNANPTLPLDSDRFAAAMVVVSIQYMTRPIETFREVCRVLKTGGTFHVIFSDRLFPTKAVAVWQALPEAKRRGELIAAYFAEAGGWSVPEFVDRSPERDGRYADPLYIVRAVKLP